MSEAFINVTEGSGKKAHTNQRTIGANDVHDEYVVAGIPFFASYVGGNGISSRDGDPDSHLMQLMAGASLNVYVTRIRVYQFGLATTAAIVPLAILRLTTAGTGGTAVTPAPLDTTDSAVGAHGDDPPDREGHRDDASMVSEHGCVHPDRSRTRRRMLPSVDYDIRAASGSSPSASRPGRPTASRLKLSTAIAAATVPGHRGVLRGELLG